MAKGYKNLIIFFAALVLGLTVTIQFKTVQQGVGIITSDTVPQLSNELHNTRDEIDSLKQQVADLRKRVEDYERAMGEQGNLNEVLQEQLKTVITLAGLTAVEGPGIEIVLNDSKWEISQGN